MKTIPIAGLLLLTACATGPSFQNADALDAERLEVAMDAKGNATEIEYHVRPEAVPAAVHEAMEALHPGGQATGAEKEYEGSTLYWELCKEVDGYSVEAMFTPDGTLHAEEVEVPASVVPQGVRKMVAGAGYGDVRAWERVHDGDQELVEYHVKTTRDDRNYKLIVSTEAELLAVFREIEAEIEVPVE